MHLLLKHDGCTFGEIVLHRSANPSQLCHVTEAVLQLHAKQAHVLPGSLIAGKRCTAWSSANVEWTTPGLLPGHSSGAVGEERDKLFFFFALCHSTRHRISSKHSQDLGTPWQGPSSWYIFGLREAPGLGVQQCAGVQQCPGPAQEAASQRNLW